MNEELETQKASSTLQSSSIGTKICRPGEASAILHELLVDHKAPKPPDGGKMNVLQTIVLHPTPAPPLRPSMMPFMATQQSAASVSHIHRIPIVSTRPPFGE